MNLFFQIVAMFSGVSAFVTLCMLVIRPIRERLLGTRAIQDGQRCLLRSDMLRTYYHHTAEDKIRQYEFENFALEYKAYKALGGNSFIDHVYKEVCGWEVVT